MVAQPHSCSSRPIFKVCSALWFSSPATHLGFAEIVPQPQRTCVCGTAQTWMRIANFVLVTIPIHHLLPCSNWICLRPSLSLSLSLSKKLALGKKWNGLRLILRPLHPLEGCWLPLADALDPLSLKVQHSAVMC